MVGPYLEGMSLTDGKKAENKVVTAAGKGRLQKKFLAIRNCQLAQMLEHIASWVHYTEQNDISQDSTSVAKI